jgi:hypothetical protein
MKYMRWYHGTSTAADLAVGDFLDPAYATHEAFVWATASPRHAQYFAESRAAIDDGEPIVFVVRLTEYATVSTLTRYDEEALEELQEEGVDAVIIPEGEDGNPELAILSCSAAFVSGIVEL